MLSAISALLLKAILPGVTTAVVALVGGLVVRQLKKVGLDVDAKQEARLKELVETAVVAVEEYARRAMKVGGPSLTGVDKRDMAAQMVLSEMPDVEPMVLQTRIDAMVPKVRQILPSLRTPPDPAKVPAPSTPGSFGRH